MNVSTPRVWALTASAGELGAEARAELGREIDKWLTAHDGVQLRTCHRVELYGLGVAPTLSAPSLKADEDAISHLFRVAAGLESVIVGEDEVLHQVRGALRAAQLSGPVDFRLQRLFETAISTGRKARSGRTESSRNLAQSAVAWLSTKSDLSHGMVVVAGSGRMGAALAHSLVRTGTVITVASRDVNRASSLARVYGGRGVDLGEGARLAGTAVGVAVALGGPWTELATIDGCELPPVADISAPQAIPATVRSRLNGSFLGIDDLYRRKEQLPGAYIEDARAVVLCKTAEFVAWLSRAR